MKKVVVTGGAGFIGSNLVDKLIEGGIEVTILDNLSTGKKENINPKAKFIKCDVAVDNPMFVGVDTIFHLAAKTAVQESIENPKLYNDVNVRGTLNMLEMAKKYGIKRFVFSSSSSVYGDTTTPTKESNPINPISPYALNKVIGEQYCKLYSTLYNIDTVCLRYFNVYGNRMNNEGGYKSVLPIFKENTLNNKTLTINNDGNQKRDFINVLDICEANIACGAHKGEFGGEIYNVGQGKNHTINEVADMFGGKKEYGNRVIEPFESLADVSKITKKLKWRPKRKLKTWIHTYI
mgnify:CR=1 FL=1